MVSNKPKSSLNFSAIEKKWQKAWEAAGVFESKEVAGKKKYYVLGAFPYPSASYLHMGHVRNYGMTDIIARYKRMRGFNVLHPMGFDAFGLPAENAAIKDGTPPKKYTEDAIKVIRKLMKELGLSYDWNREVVTCYPDYYRWNQWLFLRMFEKGVAYRAKSPVNWCPKDNTVLANEEVIGGRCWRCNSEVETKDIEQWFLRITSYAEELLRELDALSWPERAKDIQRNWIGRSEGTKVVFSVKGSKHTLEVFTTRPDTLFGVSFVALALQHPLVAGLVQGTKQASTYARFLKEHSASEKFEFDKEKKGFFTGRYAIHPLTGNEIPIYAGTFVVAGYGTGAVMGVPAHDARDFEFAKKHTLPILSVIDSGTSSRKEAYTGEGKLINSDAFSGLESTDARTVITNALEKKGVGGTVVEYRLRDWLISRQRYWGTPIPIVYCESCGVVPVPEKDLPVLLPEKVQFTGKGNPLLTNKAFLTTSCPVCGGSARRETDTMATFFDSSWYYLRYCSPQSHDVFDRKAVGHWMPADLYILGPEHVSQHLIYARFFAKFLRDLGWVTFNEPFPRVFVLGVVQKDGLRMSKSNGNAITAQEVSKKYGIDAARLFVMFVAGSDKDMEWDEHGIEGAHRFVTKFISLFDLLGGEASPLMEHKLNTTLALVEKNYESFDFNKSIIAFMDLVDYLARQPRVPRFVLEKVLLMISPVMPHLAEELWSRLGNATLVVQEAWPRVDNSKIDERFDIMEQQTEKTVKDILTITNLITSRGGTFDHVYIYVLPHEKDLYHAQQLSLRVQKPVSVFAVNDPRKYDPQGKSGKVKPGRPGIYVE
ncbi:MAG: leucine--tRNA ligase [Nanoarchaeota archaeon]